MALLRASGKTASYKYGACDFSYAQLVKWVGLSATPFSHITTGQLSSIYPGVTDTPQMRKSLAAYEFFNSRGFYYIDALTVGSEVWIALPHVWVEYNDNGTVRKLLPAYKEYEEVAGINLTAATGYSRTQMLTAAGGYWDSSYDYVQNLQYSGIASKLGTMTNAQLTTLKDSHHERDAASITGTRRIKPVVYTSLAAASPVSVVGSLAWIAEETWSAIPAVHMSKLHIQCGTYNYGGSPPGFTGQLLYDNTINLPELRGRKLSLTFSGNTASIRLDEVLLGGQTFTVNDPTVDVRLHVTHNHYRKVKQAGGNYVDSDLTRHNQAETKRYLKADTHGYCFIYAFGNPDKVSCERQELLDSYRRSGLTESDWRVRTEILNVLGLQWMYQTWQAERVLGPVFNVQPLSHHRFGRMGQESSFYIDVGLQLSADEHRHQDFAKEKQFNHFTALVASAMEHGVIEQMQGESVNASSTVKMIYLANQEGVPIWRARSANWNFAKASFVNYVNQVTPAGSLVPGVWYQIVTRGIGTLTDFTQVGAPNNDEGTVFSTAGPTSGTGTATRLTPAGQLIIGAEYRIISPGTPSFTEFGATDNLAGTTFIAIAQGSGTGKAAATGAAESELAELESSILNKSGIALVPRRWSIGLQQWKGVGFAVEEPNNAAMKISGGYFGGYNAQQLAPAQAAALIAWLRSDPANLLSPGTILTVPYTAHTTPRMVSTDPVDMASGAFVLDKTELTVGSGSGTRGLSFSRHYNSNRRFDKSPGLGYGWTHNYDISAVRRSSVKAGLGETISYHAAPFYAAMTAAADLHANHANAKEWATAALIVHWAVDQLKYNAVAVTMGNKTIEFIKMPNGTFQAPAGMNLTLAPNGTAPAQYYTLTERNGPTYTFNADGSLKEIKDLWDKKLQFTYTDGLLTSVKDAYDRTLTFTRSNGRIDSITDGTSRNVSFDYTGDDLTACTDAENKAWSYQYDDDHRMTHTRDPSNRLIIQNFYDSESRVCEQRTFGHADKIWRLCYTGYCNMEERPLLPGATTPPARTSFLFDARGRAIGTVNPLGERAEMYYDGQDRMVTTITPKGERTDHYYDKNNNLLSTRDPADEWTETSYDDQNRVATITDRRGKVTTVNSYNSKHQPTQVTAPLGRVTSTSYIAASGEVDTVTDPELKVTDYDYDTLGQVTMIKRGVAGTMTTTQEFTAYTSRGDVEAAKDALGRTTSYTYNKRRQLLTATLPAITGQSAAVIEQTYDDQGELAQSIDARLNITSHTYSPTAKPLTTTLPAITVLGGDSLNNVLTNTYDVRDWPSSSVNSLGHTSSVIHDDAERVVKGKDPLNRETLTTYDANGRPTEVRDPLLRVTKSAYTARGETQKNTDGLNKDTIYSYDENGNRLTVLNRRGETYNFTYDDASRPSTLTTPTGKVTTTTYYQNDLPATVREPSLQLTTLTYDHLLRLSSKTDNEGTITYGYDANSNLLTVTEGAAVLTRTYDERNRLRTFTNADGDLIQYEYDQANNLTGLTYPPDAQHPAGKKVTYTWNARNLLETVTDWANRTTTYHYDRAGRLLRTDRPNGTSHLRELAAAGQVLSTREIITSTGRIFHYQKFVYDAAGQVTEKFSAPAGPPGSSPPAFAATYDDDNRLAAVNGQAVVHDADGNMTHGPVGTGSGGLQPPFQTLTYNARNQLTAAAGLSYTYDAEGRRRTMTQGGAVTRYTIDPAGTLSRLLIKHAPGGAKTYYVYGLGLLYEVNAADAAITYHYDQSGSTILRTDDTGHDLGRAAYSPYGLLTWKTGNMDTPLLYNGRFGVLTDPSGLLHMRARYYSPYLMRFLNPDPIGFSGGSNWFAYAGGNPVSLSDPLGLFEDRMEYNGGFFHDGLASFVNYGIGALTLFDTVGNAMLHPFTAADAIQNQVVAEAQFAANDPLGYIDASGAALRNTIVTAATDPAALGEFGGGLLLGYGAGRIFGATGEMFPTANSGGAKPLALGLKDAGLEGFAQARGATIATGENWQATVSRALADPKTPVHFNLDGVNPWAGAQRAAAGRGGPTDWELLQIKQNPQFWDSLHFWEGGKPATNPFK